MKKWEENVRKVIPYIPGEQPNEPNMIKLNTNENPYPPAPLVQYAVDTFQTERLRLYPDPTAKSLVSSLASYYEVEEKQVFVGVGSDDVLALIFLTFFNGKKPILFPDITYSFYEVWANLYGIPFEKQALDEGFKLQKEDYFKENGGIIFPNPNAPTGIYEELSAVEEIVAKNSEVIVVIDEAYIDFGGVSALALVEKYDNLLVVQTFSKSRSMAGMRIGFAIGNEKLIQYLQDVKYSFNSYTMNQASLCYGVEAIRDQIYFEAIIKKIIQTREYVKIELKKLGFSFPDSKTNFIFATHATCKAKELFEMLKQKQVYVRHFSLDRIDNYLRITIGTGKEMNVLLDILREYIDNGAK